MTGSSAMAVLGRGTGIVASFDEARGLGEIRADDGEVLPFHCTQIADGSRTIAVGAVVEFEIVAGPLGRREAATIRTPLSER